jgi:predicted Zn-dependent peptidase
MRYLALTVFTAVLAAQAQDIPPKPEGLKYGKLQWDVPTAEQHRSVLKNGMIVYAIEDRSLPKTDLTILLRAGSFWEPAGKEGLASMCGSVMRTGGTEKTPAEALDERLEFRAIQLGVSVGDTQGNASLGVLTQDLDEGLGTLAEVLSKPAFRQDKIDLYKAQILNSMRARNDSPNSIEGREANLLLYGDYPVNRHPTKASVESITREDLAAFHKRFFHPSNMIVAAAGDFSKQDFLAKLEKAFANWPTSAPERVAVPKVAHEPKAGVFCFQTRDPVPQGRVTIGHPGIDLKHPDAFPVRIMSYIFGQGGFSSRLVKVVRTDAGLAYSVYCNYSPGVAYQGTFRMAFQSKSESCLYAAKLCLQELERMQKEDVTAEELKGAINFYLDAFPSLFFSTPSQTAGTLASAEFNDYPKDYYKTYRDKIQAVTAHDVKRVAREHMRADKLVYVFVGNLPAIKGGDGAHEVKIEDFGAVQDVPLPDPMTLQRPSTN